MKKAYLIDEKNKKLLEHIVLELNKNMREFVDGEIRQRTIQKLISEIIIPSLFEISKEDLRSLQQ